MNTNYSNFSNQDHLPNQIHIQVLVKKYTKYWYIFAISIIICLIISYNYIRYSTPIYRTTSTILIKDDKNSPVLPSNSSLNDISLIKSQKNIDNEIIVLRSRSLMERVLQELDYKTSHFLKGNIKDIEIHHTDLPYNIIITDINKKGLGNSLSLTLLNSDNLQIEDEKGVVTNHKFGEKIKTKYATFTIISLLDSIKWKIDKPFIVRFNDVTKLAKTYSNQLEVFQANKQASVITLAFTDEVPEKAREILYTLVEVYNKEASEDKNLISKNTIEFIEDRLVYLGEELTEVEKDVESFKQRNQVANINSQVNKLIEEASDYNKSISESKIQVEILNSIKDYISTDSNAQQLIPSTLTTQDPTLTSLIAKYNELNLQRSRMLRTVPEGNPVVQSISEQLNNLKLNILENIHTLKNNLLITSKNLEASSGQFGYRIKQVPTIERELLEISRQQEIKQALYLYLLQKREESYISLAAAISNFRILDSAETSENPISPKKTQIYLFALIIGIIFPIGYINIRDILNDKIRNLEEVENLTTAPILGELIQIKSKESLVVKFNDRSPLTEMFHLIRTNLNFATTEKNNKVILVTSTKSGEGKSFFSLNFAASLVMTGKKVIILDFDLRKKDVTQNLEFINDLGISNYLVSDDISVDDIVTPSQQIPNLYFASSGPLPPNPASQMTNPKVEKLLYILKQSFDHIIIDTAPIGIVADAFSLGPHIDSTIFITKYNFTLQSETRQIDKLLFKNRLKNLMLVLNGSKSSNRYGYGYGYLEKAKTPQPS